MRVDVLGPLAVVVDGDPVEIAAPKQRAVITALAMRAGRPVTTTELIDAVWGDDSPRTAKESLQSHLSRLRGLVGAERVRRSGADYTLDLEPSAVDLAEFVTAIDDARSFLADGRPADARTRVRRALDLWRSDPIPDLADGAFATAERTRLAELHAGAEDLAVEAALRAGDAGSAVAELERLVEADPLREHRWALLVEALYASGRQADALPRAYQRARDHLANELGIEPGPELRDIEARVIAQDPTLGTTTTPPTHTGRDRELGAFLFTDIEGSTPLWANDTDAMSNAVARHDELIEESCGRRGGVVFSKAGDSYAVRFDDVASAVAAAVEAQASLSEEAWATDAPIAVRMGIHVGTAEERGGNWFGPALNVASRVMSLGHGGQILVTGDAHAMHADLDAPARGSFQLRGVPGMVEIREVVVDPSRRFPPLDGDDADRFRLPTFTSALYGREDDVAEVTRSLAEHRLVSIVGLGGMGKTRMAVAAAERFVDHTPDGITFVDLQAVDHADGVLPACITALGLQPLGSDLAANLHDHLSKRRYLVVLDNCEHVVDTVADLVAGLLQAGPGVHVLVTSRERLDVDGEHVILARSLTVGPDSPARRLFLDRASHVDPDFAPSADELVAVDGLTERLDGLPLAIELAAARVNVLSPIELLEHLDDRFRLLGGGRRRRASRERTLRTTLDWSYQLLDADEQRLLSRLAVFPASFDAQAVAAVAEVDELGAVDLLESLHAKSLINAVEEQVDRRRFRLLETVRAYADDLQSNDGTTEEVRLHHARHFLERMMGSAVVGQDFVARTLAIDHGYAWLDATAAEVPNLLAAIDTLLDQEDCVAAVELLTHSSGAFFELGFGAEGHARIDRLVRHKDRLETDMAAFAMFIRAQMSLTRMDMANVYIDLEEAAQLAAHPSVKAWIVVWDAIIRVGGSPLLDDREVLRSKIRDAADLIGPADRSWSSVLMCLDHLRRGEDEDVIRLWKSTLFGPVRGTIDLFTTLAAALALANTGAQQEGLEVLDAIGPVPSAFDVTPLYRAIVLAGMARFDEARAQLRIVARRASLGKLPMAPNDAIIGLAVVAHAEGDAERARALLIATKSFGTSSLVMIVAHRLALELDIGWQLLEALADGFASVPDLSDDPIRAFHGRDFRNFVAEDVFRAELTAGSFD